MLEFQCTINHSKQNYHSFKISILSCSLWNPLPIMPTKDSLHKDSQIHLIRLKFDLLDILKLKLEIMA